MRRGQLTQTNCVKWAIVTPILSPKFSLVPIRRDSMQRNAGEKEPKKKRPADFRLVGHRHATSGST